MACKLCGQMVVAPVDHLAYQHGIDNVLNRYTTREAHIVKMRSDVVVQHLIQDGAELNKLRADILAVNLKLYRLNTGYQSIHGLSLIGDWVMDRDHPSFTMNRQQGRTKQGLVEKLVGLRKAGLLQGKLYSSGGEGSHSEVLADLKEVLVKMEKSQKMADPDLEGWEIIEDNDDA